MSKDRWHDFFRKSLESAEAEKLLRRRSWHIDHSSVEYQTASGQRLINFGTNDYLGLRHEAALIHRASQAMMVDGVGAGASPLVSGYTLALAELESQLARWQKCEAALVFTSGLAMNIGVIATLAGPNDLVLSDRLNHASLIDGCRLSGAHKRIYEHADVTAAEQLLKEHRGRYERSILITESVFSMDGDIAPLVELTDLCQRYDVGLIVDEAHATGLFGATGAGLGEQLQLTDRWLVKLGTLSKGIGTCGGFATGHHSLIDFLVNRCRSYIYSTAIAPPVVAATSAALDLIPTLDERRSRLIQSSHRLRRALAEQGWNVPDGMTPIVPVMVGSSEQALEISAQLHRSGFYVPAIRPPTVPINSARLRISLSAAHTDIQIDRLIASLNVARLYEAS